MKDLKLRDVEQASEVVFAARFGHEKTRVYFEHGNRRFGVLGRDGAKRVRDWLTRWLWLNEPAPKAKAAKKKARRK